LRSRLSRFSRWIARHDKEQRPYGVMVFAGQPGGEGHHNSTIERVEYEGGPVGEAGFSRLTREAGGREIFSGGGGDDIPAFLDGCWGRAGRGWEVM